MSECVIGLGKVGLAYSTFIASKGHYVIGVENNKDYLEKIKNKTFVPEEPNVNIDLVKEYTDVPPEECDICIVLVATPTCYAGYDHTILDEVLFEISKDKYKFKHVLVSATTQPGYMKKWETFHYNPLFIQLGNIIDHQNTTRNVLVGGEQSSLLDDFFKSLHREDVNIHYMSKTAAEVAKLSLNCLITTKISFANMISEAMWRANMNDETDKVLDFVGSDPRIGKNCLKAGWGYGGPCFPRDNRALCTFLREHGASDYIPVATHETNERHAIIKALQTPDPSEFEDLGYKPNCPVKCFEESHKIKTLSIIKNFKSMISK